METQTIVIDGGSGSIKAGYAGEETPLTTFPTLVGHSKPTSLTENCVFVGDEAQSKREILTSLKSPIEHGIITNWDLMEKLWDYTFQHLKADPSEHPLIHTEVPTNDKKSREKMTQIMFEGFSVPGFYVSMAAVLSLYASGRTTGISVDVGDGGGYSVPVYEGNAFDHHIVRLDVAGDDLNAYLMRMLKERGIDIDRNVARDLKEKLCFVSGDLDKDMREGVERSYELPDGQVITLGRERFLCPELMFHPSGIGQVGIPEGVYSSIRRCDPDTRRFWYGNIVLSGGTTMFTGFAERVEKELVYLSPAAMKVKVIAPPSRNLTAWIGGSVLGSLSTFQQVFITKQEYEEVGALMVHRKCY